VSTTVTRLAAEAVAAGVRPDGLLIDPGHDLGKTTHQSLEVTRRLDELVATGWPVLVAVSNKDFIGETLDQPVEQRLNGTLAVTAVAAWLGARVFRAHNVSEVRQALDMVASIRGDRPPTLAGRGLRRTFQQNAFFGELSVLDNTAGALIAEHSTGLVTSILAPWREAATRRRAVAEAAKLLESFGIGPEYHGERPADIPYGIQRLLSVALAYGSGVRALLLDEPAAGTGGTDMRRLADLLVELRRRGVAVVVIEHHMDLIMSIADRIVMIDQGVTLATGTPKEIQRNEAVREAYLGRDE